MLELKLLILFEKLPNIKLRLKTRIPPNITESKPENRRSENIRIKVMNLL